MPDNACAPFALPVDHATGEPYLPSAVGDIVVTTTRPSDEEAMVELCNIPTVGEWFYHRPYPYAAHDFQAALAKRLPAQEAAIASIKTGEPTSTFPFTAIRDTKTGRLIGDIDIFPSPEHPPSEEIWEVSYVLHPDYQGRGIARAVVEQSIQWAVAAMGVKRVEAYTQCRNVSSAKLLQKLDFTQLDSGLYPWPEEKGGGQREVARYQKEL